MVYLLGVDAGTTSFKAALFDENGIMKASAAKSYRLETTADSFVEFCAEGYWSIFKDIVRELLEKSGVTATDIKALAIDSQGETLIPVDKNGDVLMNAIVWLDNRAVNQASIIEKEFGCEKVYERTGQPEIAPLWPASKILWIRHNRRDIFDKTYKFLLLEDYLLFKLTGKYVTEKSLISSTIYFDIQSGEWWGEMLDFLGCNTEKLPRIMESGECVGEISDKASWELGLGKDTLVVSGALDQVAGMIGAGNTGGNIVTETTGTCLGVCINTGEIPPYRHGLNVPCHIHAIKGKYFIILWSQTAGFALEWFCNNFYGKEFSFLKVDEEAGKIRPGSDGLLMLPHLNGTAFPDFNPDAKGLFYGIKSIHTRAHFSRSIMEAVAYMLKEHLDRAEEMGTLTGEIRSLGGGARSSLWNHIKADVTGRRIMTPEIPETTCLGAAILAGTGIGIFESIEKACEKLVRIKGTFEPELKNTEIYQASYKAYKNLYTSLKEMFTQY